MRITSVRTTLLTGPSTGDPFLREARQLRSAAFVEIDTDTPHTGLGETYAGYFAPETVPAIVDFFAPVLVGQPVDNVEELWRRMYHCGNFWCRVGLGASVLNGIEAALWDLAGKRAGKPVYELLSGAKHTRLAAYATGGPSNYPLERLAAKMDYYLSLGFRGFKLGAGSYSASQGWRLAFDAAEAADFEAAKLAFVRQRVGPDVEVMIDAHMGNRPSEERVWSLETAEAVARAMAPFRPFFLEEPLPYTDAASYGALCRKGTGTPVAGGECLTTCEWKVFAEAGAFDVAQPDASFLGGMGEFLRAAAGFDAVATHAWGAAGSLMQNVHCGFACRGTRILEVAPAYAGLHEDVLDGAFVMRDGLVLPPDRPGLGIRLNDEIRRRYPFVPGSGEFNSVPGKMLTT